MSNSLHTIPDKNLIVQLTNLDLAARSEFLHENRFKQEPIVYADDATPPTKIEAFALLESDNSAIPIVQCLLREGYRDHGVENDWKVESLFHNHGKSRVFFALTTDLETGVQTIPSTMSVAWGGEVEGSTPHTEIHYLTVTEDGQRFTDILGIPPEEYIEIKGLVTARGTNNPLMFPTFVQLLRGCRDWGETRGAEVAVALMKPSLATTLRRFGVSFLDVDDLHLDWNGQNPSEEPLHHNNDYFKRFYPYFKERRQLLAFLRQNGKERQASDGSTVTPNLRNLLLFRDEVEENWAHIRSEVPDHPRVYMIDLDTMKRNLNNLAHKFAENPS